MVDRNHLKIADQAPVADDDPFAELTRIMGFDPREPVKPATPAAADSGHDDDFSIDLEKELMGEFEAAEADDAPAQDTQFEAPEVAAVDAGYHDEIEFDLAEDFHEELAAAAAEDVQPEAAAFDDSYDTGVNLDLDGDFDDALAASVEKDMALGDDWPEADVAGEPEQAAAAAPVAPVDEAVAEDQLADHFDAALADVDMDFRLGLDAGDEAVAAHEDADVAAYSAPPVEPEALPDHPEMVALAEVDLHLGEDELHLGEDDLALDDQPVQHADAFDAGEAELDASDAEDPLETELPELPSQTADDQPAYAAAPGFEPQHHEQPLETSELSLEDELNALLGNSTPAVSSDAAVAEQHVAAGQYDNHSSQQHAGADLDWGIGDEEQPAEVVAADHDQTIEGDAPAVHAAAHNDLHDDLDLSGLDFHDVDDQQEFAATDHQAEARHDDAAGGDDLPDFDHDAFDAAIANGMQGSPSHDGFDGRHDGNHYASQPEPEPAHHKEDPLDVIAALTAKYSAPLPSTFGRSNPVAQPAPQPEPAPLHETYDAGEAYDADEGHEEDDQPETGPAAAFDGAPDIETIEVHDKAVALADDLDIPELAYEEELPPVSAYDDLDSEFANLLNDMNAGEPAPQRAAADAHEDDFAGDDRGDASDDHAVDHGYAPETAAAVGGAAAAAAAVQTRAATHAAYDDELGRTGYAYDDPHDGRSAHGGAYEAGDYGYDPDLDNSIAAPAMTAANERARPRRRGMLIGAVVGGVAIAGGLGAFALSFGGGDDVPALVKADNGPVKVKPENPGGTVVPNQDNKVYETVAGKDASSTPQQEKLVTTAEEPVDVTPPPAPEPRVADLAPVEEDTAPTASGKGEDRIEQILAEAEADVDTKVAAIAPRKVRTMVVKPDGTLVPREDPAPAETAAPAPQAAAPTAEAAVAAPETSAPDTTATVPDATPSRPSLVPPAGGTAPVAETPAAPEAQPAQAMPNSVPLAPQRPAEQPVDVVGEVKPDQVAALSPVQATPSGAWSMQIASQPSEAAAQSSYQDLVRRYGSVLNGHEANIVKAEIAGKGTFWRVRIPAPTRNEAISLCENYKAAGGNCFVSR